MADAFPQPERPETADGRTRRVGFELELAGIDMETIDRLITDCYGGEVVADDRFSHRVTGTRLGDFGVEIDTVVLKEGQYLEFLQALGLEVQDTDWLNRLEDTLEWLAATLVPHEVVTPPVPVDRAGELDELRATLHAHQARGTRWSLRFAFGLHINPEAASLAVEDITAHLKAFLLLRDALKHYGDVDLSRRVAPFIRDFPEAYARHVVAPGYEPDWSTLVSDYTRDNPTRNRPLDLLPLFAHCAADALPAALREDVLIKPRPTYHYRLPNCAIDEGDWSLGREWARWLAVERLAARPGALAELGRDYLSHRGDPLSGIDHDWARYTAPWLDIPVP